jgi:Ser/Thr protein kinase RdoA (MazF antagonist)
MLRRMLDWARIAAEFGLGRPLGVAPLAGGHADVTRLTTARGTFVIKPAYGPAEAEDLSEQAALVLSAAGIRQARRLRTTAGSLVSESGHTVQEFLPGEICLRPTPAQTTATMRHAGAYHAALEQVPVPAWLLTAATVWDRVASAEYLVGQLPDLLRSHSPPGRAAGPPDRAAGPPGRADHGVVMAALGQIELALPLMRQLPRQLVHGDIGPDNVLMHREEVVAIVDFTPSCQPVLFAVATAVYWYHVHGHRRLDPGAIRASLAAAGRRPWTAAEREVWPAMLAREALRRLATPLAVAAEAGTGPRARTGERYRAVLSIMNSWPQLQGHVQ